MARVQLRGLGVAMVTPFKSDGALDEKSFEKLVDFLIEGGVDYLVPCGTTGENPTLTHEEHLRVLELTVKRAARRVPVIGGAGSNATTKAVDLAVAAADLGCEGLLTITPFYNKPTPDGLLRHFGAQSGALEKRGVSLPMILYNVPGRTGLNMTAATTLRIAKEVKGVSGVKEASGNMEQILELLRTRPEGFLVISGDDAWALPLIASGADGVISVSGNEVPREMKALVKAALDGDLATARTMQNRLLPLLLGNFMESNPGPVKAAMKLMGILDSDTMRAPLAPMTASNLESLRDILKECGLGVK